MSPNHYALKICPVIVMLEKYVPQSLCWKTEKMFTCFSESNSLLRVVFSTFSFSNSAFAFSNSSCSSANFTCITFGSRIGLFERKQQGTDEEVIMEKFRKLSMMMTFSTIPQNQRWDDTDDDNENSGDDENMKISMIQKRQRWTQQLLE